MNTIYTTKQEGIALTTTPVKVWSVNSSRVGIEVNAPEANASNLLIFRVPAGTGGTPTVTDATACVRIPPGATFEGDNRYNGAWDIWAAAAVGSIIGNFYEVAN